MSHLFIGSFSILSIYRNDTNLPFIFLSDVLNEEDVNNSLIMIQPTLTSYTFDNPVLLDSVFTKNDVILARPIVIFDGEFAQWRKAGKGEL